MSHVSVSCSCSHYYYCWLHHHFVFLYPIQINTVTQLGCSLQDIHLPNQPWSLVSRQTETRLQMLIIYTNVNFFPTPPYPSWKVCIPNRAWCLSSEQEWSMRVDQRWHNETDSFIKQSVGCIPKLYVSTKVKNDMQQKISFKTIRMQTCRQHSLHKSQSTWKYAHVDQPYIQPLHNHIQAHEYRWV